MIGEMLSWGFMQRALAAGLAVSAVCGFLSFFVVLRKMAFAGAGIAHSAFGGVAIGVVLGLSPEWTALAFAAAVAVGIGLVKRGGRFSEDSAIGIFFAASMAAGVALLSIGDAPRVDLFGYLFGNILAVTAADLRLILGVAALVCALLAAFFKELLFLTFDEEAACAAGIPARPLELMLLVLLALTVVISIRITGIILVSALLVIPASIARNLVGGYRAMIAVSLASGLLATVAGLAAAWRFNLPPGSAIVLVATLLFFLSFPARRPQ